jgi:predicted permease
MFRDLRYALRMLVKAPAFTAIAALSLALGIGANTAVFSLVNAALLKPLPLRDVDRLAAVFTTDRQNPGNLPLSDLNYQDLRDQNDVFSELGAFSFAQLNYSAAEPEQILSQVVTPNYFSLLGAEPVVGRAITLDDDVKKSPVVVVSDGFWRRRLGGRPNVVGTALTLNRMPFTIIGIAPEGFTGTLLGAAPDVWVPMSLHDVLQPGFDFYGERRGLFLFVVGRLKPSVSLEQASSNLSAVFARLESAYPADNRGRSAVAVSLLDARLNPTGQGGPVVLQLSAILMTVVGIVLLIACANVANLLLSRASKRRREIAIRLSLGASRARLVGQLLAESTMLALVGGILGVLLAYWITNAVASANVTLPIPVDDSALIDRRVLSFTTFLSLLTGLVFGLAPALQASRPNVLVTLKHEAVPIGAGRRGFLALMSTRQALVVVQMALSLLAVATGGLFLRSLQAAQKIDPGFETERVIVTRFNLGREGYSAERGQLFYEQLVERARTIAGSEAAAVAGNAPLTGPGFSRSIVPEGQDTTQQRVLVQVNSVTPGYLATVGTPLLRGRDFASTDVEGAPLVVIINDVMAQRFWPGQDAVGKRFKFFGDQQFTTVIGVAQNAKYNTIAEEPIPFIYQPLRQNYSPAATLHVRATGNASALAAPLRRLVQEIDPTMSVFDTRTLQEQVAESLQPLRFNVVMLTAFGALALLLAAVGLYGVASYNVAQRTREIGVRMALGAQRSSVISLVLGQGAVLVAIGLAVGLVLAFAATAFLPQGLLVNVRPRDPLTFVVTPLLLAAVAIAATYVPALRATQIDPLIALRRE